VTAAIAAAVAGALAAGAWVTGWFSPAGAAAGGLIAAIVLGGAGWGGLLLLGLFVVSGSVLSRAITGNGKRETGNENQAAGRFPFPVAPFPPHRRAAQVIAKGWTAAVGAALVPLAPDAGWAVLAGGLAAAQADTWATEVGMRARRPPVLLTTGAVVPPGTSGGVTPLGTAAGFLGAIALGGAAGVVTRDPGLALAATAAGAAGMLADSVLGATVQAAYRCAVCDAAVEGARHCGAAARRLGGRPWITNDVVNGLATGAGGALAAALTAW
jgi:uncharacterized protein (TIGR00297 family)